MHFIIIILWQVHEVNWQTDNIFIINRSVFSTDSCAAIILGAAQRGVIALKGSRLTLGWRTFCLSSLGRDWAVWLKSFRDDFMEMITKTTGLGCILSNDEMWINFNLLAWKIWHVSDNIWLSWNMSLFPITSHHSAIMPVSCDGVACLHEGKGRHQSKVNFKQKNK